MNDSFVNLSILVSSFDPWYIVSFAILVILIDIFLINSETFLWLGVALILVAILNAINLPPIIQLWSYPVSLFIVFVSQRYIGQILYRSPDPYRDLETYVGQVGTLRIQTSKTDNAAHFQNTPSLNVLDSMSADNDKELISNITVAKIEFSDGKIFPAKIKNIEKFKDGDIVTPSSVQNYQLFID